MHDALLADPDFLPFKLDLPGRRVLFVRLSAAERAAAPFLDERALRPNTQGFWLPLESLLDAAQSDLPHAPDFIFHIGHCGSTLVSRVLETWPEVQALREPLPLRTLADECHRCTPGNEWQRVLARLLSRWAFVQPPHRRSIVKATSSCNALIAPILDLCADSRVILLDASLSAYLATLFKSDASMHDAAVAAPGRHEYLLSRLSRGFLPIDPSSAPLVCAMGWIAEQLRFEEIASSRHGARVLRVDFDEFLARPREKTSAMATHLGFDQQRLDTALRAPAWTRYSKAQDQSYAAEDRLHDLELARRSFEAPLASGVAWVQRLLGEHPELRPQSLRLE